MNLEEMKRKRDTIISLQENTPIEADVIEEIQAVKQEASRLVNITDNAREILDDIDREFEKITSLNNVDTTFLFFAIMLQTARWIFSKKLQLPGFENLSPEVDKSERLSSNEKEHKGGRYDGESSGACYETEELKEYRKDHEEKTKESTEEFYKKNNKYRSWIEILTQPVPYDAMNALDPSFIPDIAGLNNQKANGLFANICGVNHHVATLGHDPVLGWIFGTANILTSTITFADIQSYRVVRGHRSKNFGFIPNSELQFSDQAIDYSQYVYITAMLEECFCSMQEDDKRFFAACFRQGVHFASDEHCKEGLPIPVLSYIDPQKAQELIEKGWNSVEFARLVKGDLKQIGKNAFFSLFINAIIYAIYLFCLDSEDDIEIRKVKIRKILSIADVVSSSSNILYVLVTKETAKLDIGGIGSTLLTYFSSVKFVGDIKREYIEKEFEKLVMGELD